MSTDSPAVDPAAAAAPPAAAVESAESNTTIAPPPTTNTPASAQTNGHAGEKREAHHINAKVFWNRLHTIYESWKKGQKPWGAAPPR